MPYRAMSSFVFDWIDSGLSALLFFLSVFCNELYCIFERHVVDPEFFLIA